MWSQFSLLDKIFFWVMTILGLSTFAILLSTSNFINALAASVAIIVSPILFLWAIFKILKNRKLMGKMMLASVAIFIISISVGIATEPQSYKDAAAARVAQEQKLEADSKQRALGAGTEAKEIASQLSETKSSLPPESDTDKTEPGTDQKTVDSSISTPPIADQPVALKIEAEPPVDTNNANLAADAKKELDTVTKVVDGDTIHTTKYKVRFIGLDTPETKDPRKPVQCFGAEASRKMTELVSGKKVYLELDSSQSSTDKYGRALRNVYLEDGTNVAHAMLRDGYGYEYTYNLPYRRQSEYKAAQKFASDNNLGLWADNVCNGKPVASEVTDPEAADVTDPDSVAKKAASTAISTIKVLADKRVQLRGFVPKNSNFVVTLANGDRYSSKSKDDGAFDITLPSSISPFGTMTLESKSGSWLFASYKPLRGMYYYSLQDKKTKFKDSVYSPVITSIRDSGNKFNVSGYYLPNAKLMIKSGKTVLGKDDTDDNGYFEFKNVSPKERFTQVAIKSYTSGWMSSSTKEGSTLLAAYMDAEKKSVSDKLPISTKNITKKDLIKFTSETRDDAALPKGETKVAQAGKNGERVITYKITYQGAKEIKREEVSNVVSKAPVAQITSNGTYVKPAPVLAQPQPVYSAPAPVAAPTPAGAYYANCTAARAAGVAPIYAGQPGYRSGLDRDNDGIACDV